MGITQIKEKRAVEAARKATHPTYDATAVSRFASAESLEEFAVGAMIPKDNISKYYHDKMVTAGVVSANFNRTLSKDITLGNVKSTSPVALFSLPANRACTKFVLTNKVINILPIEDAGHQSKAMLLEDFVTGEAAFSLAAGHRLKSVNLEITTETAVTTQNEETGHLQIWVGTAADDDMVELADDADGVIPVGDLLVEDIDFDNDTASPIAFVFKVTVDGTLSAAAGTLTVVTETIPVALALKVQDVTPTDLKTLATSANNVFAAHTNTDVTHSIAARGTTYALFLATTYDSTKETLECPDDTEGDGDDFVVGTIVMHFLEGTPE